MQNYGQSAYERPGSTASFTGQPQPPVPQYHQQQWGQPAPQQQQQLLLLQQQQQQQQQAAGSGYNPGTYGVMPGGYAQGSQYPLTTQTPDPHASQPYSDVPPPPPPKPYGFAAAVHNQNDQSTQYGQNTQSWQQSPALNTGFTPQAQQGGYPVYNTNNNNSIAPPPSSTIPAESYFASPHGGRPGSMYDADQAGASASAAQQRPQSVVMSPNEQAPAYIPPSLSGKGVQAYMPSNTNPLPGVYVPPPPDIPAWQQAQRTSPQGGNKRFVYAKPTVDPSFYAQGYQGPQPVSQHQLPPAPPPLPPRYEHPDVLLQQAQQPYGQQPQRQPQSPLQSPVSQQQQQHQHPQVPAQFGQLGQPVQSVQPLQQQFSQSSVPLTYIQQQAAQLEQYAQTHQHQQAQQQAQQQMQGSIWPQPQWQTPVSAQHDYGQQHQDSGQPVYGYQQQQGQHMPNTQHQQPISGQPYRPVLEQTTQVPTPVEHTDTAPSNLVHQSSSQSYLVSPITNQGSAEFIPGYPTSARTDSVSSIALANLHSQRAANRTVSPKPLSFNNPTPPPRDDASRFSALGAGGPSDWETLGAGDEIDDEALFVKKEPKYNESVQPDSVELPAHQPSPPSTQAWPSPTNQHASLSSGTRHDTYQPTPPTATVSPVHRIPSPKTPQQSSISGTALVAPLRASSLPFEKYKTPQEAHHGFVMGEVMWDVPKQISNASQQSQATAFYEDVDRSQGAQIPGSVQIPPPIQIPASNTPAPAPQTPRQARPEVNRFFSDVGTTWGLPPKDEKKTLATRESKGNIDIAAELKAKDEELWDLRRQSKAETERIQAEIEAGKAGFMAEIDRLKAHEEAARTLASQKSLAFDQQVEAMKVAAEQAKSNADVLKKENDLTIERIKEDVEGKEDTIRERDATIADLRKQLDDIRVQLEEERAKAIPEPSKPTALDLIPDLDPWYAGSLERYITMLRGEANEPQVAGKIKTFKAFLRTESGIRGIEYYDTAPTAVTTQQAVSHQSAEPTHFQKSPDTAVETRGLIVDVSQGAIDDDHDDHEYSPGGRPLLKRATIPGEDNGLQHMPFVPSSQSTAILTPTSSVHDDSTATQPSLNEQSKPQYKAYVPPVMSNGTTVPLAQRQTGGLSIPTAAASPIGSNKNHDEIFFGDQGHKEKQMSNRLTSSDETSDIPVVAPLSFASSRPVSISVLSKSNALDILDSLLPSQVKPVSSRSPLKDLRKKAAFIEFNPKNVVELTESWEKLASQTREKNGSARRKRAEDSEAHNDDLFNSDEISYAELKDLEAELEEQERKLKSQEDQEECKNYVEIVFDKVYNDLQIDITALTDLYIEAETLLQTSVSGIKSLDGGDALTTKACLELLVELHEQIEKTHSLVVQAVAERDKRYKKTEIQLLYTAGNIAKMKSVEKHFEQAEKQAIHRAKNEKAQRMNELVKVAEEAVINAATKEQSDRGRIIAAVRNLKEDDNVADMLSRAHEALSLLHQSSKSLLALFNGLEIELNTAEVEADVAQARVNGASESDVQELQAGMSAREAELKEEFARRIDVLDQDRQEFEQLIKDKEGNVQSSDGHEKETRLKMALEEAKRRNGHA